MSLCVRVVLLHIGCVFVYILFFFFKHKTAYEMRISDWSSDVCSSDLAILGRPGYWADPTIQTILGNENSERAHAYYDLQLGKISGEALPRLLESVDRKSVV